MINFNIFPTRSMPKYDRWIVIDFETASMCDLKACGSWRYAQDVSTQVLCLSYENERGRRNTWFPGTDPSEGLMAALRDPTVCVIAHNVSFEKAIWRFIMVPAGWPDIPDERWHDTAAVCAMRGFPIGLEQALMELGGPMQKDMEGNKLTLSLSKAGARTTKNGSTIKGMLPEITPQILARVGQYCESDIYGQVWIHKRMGWLPPKELELWLLNQKINERGVRLDMEYVRACQSVVDQATAALVGEFEELTGGLGFNQGAKIIAWCQSKGFNLPNMQKETLVEVLGWDPDETDEDETLALPDDFTFEPVPMPDDVRRALTIRQLVGSSSIKKLRRMEQCVNYDSRARGLLQYHGTGPGRNTSRLFQIHNFPKGTIKVDDLPPDPETLVAAIKTRDVAYIEMMYGPAVETVVQGLRHAITVDPGNVMMAGDYAGIQARLVLSVAGQHDKTALMAGGVDVYCDMAAQIYKRPIDKHKDPKERGVGKNSVLGLGFQMGGKTFQFKYGKDLTLEFCEGVVQIYREEWAPLVPKVWAALQSASIKALEERIPVEAYGLVYRIEDRWLTCQLPGGNKLWYADPQLIWKRMTWSTDEEPVIRRAWSFKSTKQKRRVTVDAFGGQLTENAIMGMERQIVADAQLRCEAEGLPVIFDVHDEVVCEVPETRADLKMFTQLLEDVKPWVRHIQVPIQVDVWQGKVYKK